MGGESRSTSIERLQDMPTGTESELVRIVGAQLFLLDGVESVRMGTGDFALIMMVQANTPLATLVAQVAEFQWPIGKDAPVLKIAHLRYSFAMPGLVYGLILPESTSQEDLTKFESHLRQYCTFEIRPEIAKAAGNPSSDAFRQLSGRKSIPVHFLHISEEEVNERMLFYNSFHAKVDSEHFLMQVYLNVKHHC